jgi:hypothetical protein
LNRVAMSGHGQLPDKAAQCQFRVLAGGFITIAVEISQRFIIRILLETAKQIVYDRRDEFGLSGTGLWTLSIRITRAGVLHDTYEFRVAIVSSTH